MSLSNRIDDRLAVLDRMEYEVDQDYTKRKLVITQERTGLKRAVSLLTPEIEAIVEQLDLKLV